MRWGQGLSLRVRVRAAWHHPGLEAWWCRALESMAEEASWNQVPARAVWWHREPEAVVLLHH